MNTRQSQIKQLLQSPHFETAKMIAQELIQKIRDQSNLGDTEWETARNVALEEGQIRGINKFIDELYHIAQKEE